MGRAHSIFVIFPCGNEPPPANLRQPLPPPSAPETAYNPIGL
jgi:hypothetical protein